MNKFPPIRVRLCEQDGIVYYGVLFQREVVIDAVKSGQIWVHPEDGPGMEDKWILDASIASMQILQSAWKGLFDK
jgi:hypothetical protein